MWTSTGPSRETSVGYTELSPLQMVALEAMLDPFCPQTGGGMYRPEDCLPWCTICRDLLIVRGGTA